MLKHFLTFEKNIAELEGKLKNLDIYRLIQI